MAVSFNGTNQYCYFLNDTLFNTITYVTVMCWVRLNVIRSTAFCGRPATSNNLWQLGIDATGHTFVQVSLAQPSGNPVTTTLTGATVTTTATWYHVAGVWDENATLSLYLNGVRDAQNAAVGGVRVATDTTAALVIGAQTKIKQQQPSLYTSGIIEDVRVYNRALTANEIQTVAASGGLDSIIDTLCRFEMDEGAVGDTVTTSTLRDSSSSGVAASGVSNAPVYAAGHASFIM